MRRASVFLLRVVAGMLAAAADHIEHAETDTEVYQEDGNLDPDTERCQSDDPDGDWHEHELPWPERRQSCVNYPHEAYYSG
jgi:hypothetical protein